MNKILEWCLHKQLTQTRKVKYMLNVFSKTVINQTVQFQTVFENKQQMTKEENVIFDLKPLQNLITNTSRHAEIKFFQVHIIVHIRYAGFCRKILLFMNSFWFWKLTVTIPITSSQIKIQSRIDRFFVRVLRIAAATMIYKDLQEVQELIFFIKEEVSNTIVGHFSVEADLALFLYQILDIDKTLEYINLPTYVHQKLAQHLVLPLRHIDL